MVQEMEREHAMAPAVQARCCAARSAERTRGEHTRDVAGLRKAFDRRHQKPAHDPDAARHQGHRIVDKGEGDLRSQRLHFESLRVNMNNVQYWYWKNEQC